MKKTILISMMAALAMVSCKDADKAALKIEVENAPDSSSVIISRLSFNKINVLDTAVLKRGKTNYNITVKKGAPEFVYVSLNENSPVSLLLSNGERTTLRMNPDGSVKSIEGSDESIKLQDVDKGIKRFNSSMDSLITELRIAERNNDAAKEDNLKSEIGRLYVQRKQESIKYIYENPYTMTVIPLVYQKTSTGWPIFSELTDALLFDRVYDSLYVKYPSSPYLMALADEVSIRMNSLEFSNRISNAESVDFPEIILPDINGKEQSLTSLKGKVIALMFWDPTKTEHRLMNTDLKEIYNKYSEKGFEIYQVALCPDKTAWALQVREQKLPWVSVYDQASYRSVAAMSYNVTQLPAIFLIDKDGSIVAKNQFEYDKLEKEISRRL